MFTFPKKVFASTALGLVALLIAPFAVALAHDLSFSEFHFLASGKLMKMRSTVPKCC
jgi:hypothetical protein